MKKVYRGNIDDETCDDIFNVYDNDKSGELDLDEFFVCAVTHGILNVWI